MLPPGDQCAYLIKPDSIQLREPCFNKQHISNVSHPLHEMWMHICVSTFDINFLNMLVGFSTLSLLVRVFVIWPKYASWMLSWMSRTFCAVINICYSFVFVSSHLIEVCPAQNVSLQELISATFVIKQLLHRNNWTFVQCYAAMLHGHMLIYEAVCMCFFAGGQGVCVVALEETPGGVTWYHSDHFIGHSEVSSSLGLLIFDDTYFTCFMGGLVC